MIPPRFEEECLQVAMSNMFKKEEEEKKVTISFFLYKTPQTHFDCIEPMIYSCM